MVQKLRINVKPSPYLTDYINTYPNVQGIFETGDTWIVVYSNMTTTQLNQFKTDVTNKLIEIVP